VPNALNRRVPASDLRFWVSLESKATNGQGWGSGTSYKADVEPIGASAMGALGLAGSEANFRITFRHTVVPKAGDRIVHDSKYYEVESVQVVPRARTVVLARYRP
jgi:hypothetical protein